jgi:hypothetical protein
MQVRDSRLNIGESISIVLVSRFNSSRDKQLV